MSRRGKLIRARAQFRKTQGEQERKPTRFYALMGDGEGTVAVADEGQMVYVRIPNRGVVKCLNTRVPIRNNLPLVVGYSHERPDTLQVLDVYGEAMDGYGAYAYLPLHHAAHEFDNENGGDDVVWVQKPQFVPWLCRPASTPDWTVIVNEGFYLYEATWQWFEGETSADLSGRVPALVGDARFVLVYVDGATNALDYDNGIEFPAAWPPGTAFSLVPVPPAGSVPVAAIYLENGQTSITWDDIYDIRIIVEPMAGSVAAAPHNLLGADVHDDTVDQDPSQGSLVVGNATPAWDELTIGANLTILESDGSDPSWVATTDGQAVSTAVRTDATAGVRPKRLGVGNGVTTPDQDGAIAQTEVVVDPTNAAGMGHIYPKDKGGQTKYYFRDDTGNILEIAGIVEDLIVTVQAAGGDFTTIQDAIDWFKNWIIKGDCVIDCDAQAYDEAVVFEGLLITPGSTLTLQGDDDHGLCGITYVDGASMNQAGIANGGSGTCALATNVARDEITITGSVTDPDFDADGWGNGDEIIIYADDGNIYERTVNSIDPGGAGNNVIEITAALPAGATLGNDGTAVGWKPHCRIERTAAGRCIDCIGVRGVVIDGWYLESHTGSDCDGLVATAGANVASENILVKVEDYGIFSFRNYSSISCSGGAISVWDTGRQNIFANNGTIIAQYVVCVAATNEAVVATDFGYVNARYAITVNCATGFFSDRLSVVFARDGTARQCTTGYYATDGAWLHAQSTNAQNNGNTADYSPAPGAIPGYGNGNGNADIYAS